MLNMTHQSLALCRNQYVNYYDRILFAVFDDLGLKKLNL